MLLGLVATFLASRKEPLSALLGRIHAAFRDGGGPLPGVRFVFADSSIAGGVSSVDRVLKRFPEMQRFLATAETFPGQPSYRQLSNQAGTPMENEAVEFDTILRIAEGVPVSYRRRRSMGQDRREYRHAHPSPRYYVPSRHRSPRRPRTRVVRAISAAPTRSN